MFKRETTPMEPAADVREEPPRRPQAGELATAAAAAPKEELQTPEQHARETGNVTQVQEPFKVGGMPGKAPLFSWQHAAAAQLHGWNQHALDSAEPFTLSREAYLAALKAAEAPVTRSVGPDGQPDAVLSAAKLEQAQKTGLHTVSEYEPHDAALSPFAPQRRR